MCSRPWQNFRALLAVQAKDAPAALALTSQSLKCVRECRDTLAIAFPLTLLAGAAGLMGDHPWVARIAGAREAVTDRTGGRVVNPMGQDLYERTVRDARRRLGPDKWTRAYGPVVEVSTRSFTKSTARSSEPGSSNAWFANSAATAPHVCMR
jgi:hypothetical protein